MFERLSALLSARQRPTRTAQHHAPQVSEDVPATFHVVRTARGNALSAGPQFVDMQDDAAALNAIISVTPNCTRNVTFLLSPDLRPIAIRDDGLRATALSAFAMRNAGSIAVRLRHPLASKRFLSVSPSGAGALNGCVFFNSLGTSLLDHFILEPRLRETLPSSLLSAARELCNAASMLGNSLDLIATIKSSKLRPGIIEAVLRVMMPDDLADFSRLIIEDPHALEALSSQLPENEWFRRVLPSLALWNRNRLPVPGHTMRSPASDEFAGDGLEGHGQVQAGFAVTALARATVRPRKCACLLACARNEGPYLLDWLAYHQSIGFEHVFLYTNDNGDGSDTLLEALAAQGAITLIHNVAGQHFGPQYKANAHALALLPQILDYRWCAILDLDEYFAFDTNVFNGIPDFVAWHESQKADAVALCWQLFAAARSDNWRDEFGPSRFLRRENGPHFLVKSIFKTRLFWNSQLHFPHSTLERPFSYRTESGSLHHHSGVEDRPAAHAANPSSQSAWINHYILRTAPEALWKLARGHGDWNAETLSLPGGRADKQAELVQFVSRTFINLADKQDLVEDRRILSCARNVNEALSRLRVLPGVSAAETAIKANFRAKLLEYSARFAETMPESGEPRYLTEFRTVIRHLVRPRAPEPMSIMRLLGEIQ